MQTAREFSLRKWSEIFAWGALAILFGLVLALPFSDAQRAATLQFLMVIAAYLALTFRFLFPRWNYAPRLIYATLLIDLLMLGVLHLLLEEQIPNFYLFYIPLIVAASIIAGARGTLLVALSAALIDFLVQIGLVGGKRHSLLAEFVDTAAFFVVGLAAIALAAFVRRHTLESADASVRAAESEHRRREEAEESARRWQVVNTVGLRVQQETSAAPILETLGTELKALGMECLIALWDEPGKTLRVEYLSIGQNILKTLERLTGVKLKSFRLKIADLPEYQKALAAKRAQLGETTDETLLRMIPGISVTIAAQVFELLGARRRIIVPLLTGDQTTGFLRVWGRRLGERDLPTMTALAQHIAVALEKVRLFEKTTRRAAQMELVNAVAERAAGIFDVDELLNQVTQLIVQRFGYHNAGILISDHAARQVIMRARAGAPINAAALGYRQSWDDGLIGFSARTKQTVVVGDVRAEPRYLELDQALAVCRSEMCIPLKRGEEVIGILDLQSTDLRAFGSEDVAVLETLASQIATAIVKAELFTAERKRAAQFGLVSAIAERVAMILDPDLLLQQAADLILEYFGYHNTGIFLLDAPAAELILRGRAGHHPAASANYRQSIQLGLVGAAARQRETILATDVSNDPRYYLPVGGPADTQSELCIPMRFGEQTLGVVDIQAVRVNAFDASDVAAMETLADQIAIALENARLYRDARRRLAQVSALYEFSSAIAATLNVPELGRRAIGALEDILSYQHGAILLIDQNRRLIPLALSQRQGTESERHDRELIRQYDPRVGKGITGSVAQTGETLRVGNVKQDSRYLAVRAEVLSELCVPLKVGERVIGVLNVESPLENAYTEEDERLLITIANPLAVAIENARLYARTKDDAEVKAALLRELSHRVKNNLTAIAGLLYLGLDEEKTTRQEILSETLARVQSMVVAHSLLSDSPRARVDVLELGRMILSDSVRHLTLPGTRIPFTVTGVPAEISARQASSIALVLNELITNAIKHAGNRETHLDLTITREDNCVNIELFNQGNVLPEDFSTATRAGVGLSLIRTLVEKDLQGRFELISRERPHGVAGVISFLPEA